MDPQDTGAGKVQPLRSDDETRERLLWTRFREAESPEEMYPNWLALQCGRLAGVNAAVLLVRNRRTGSFGQTARWPAERRTPPHLRAAAEKAAKEGRPLALQLAPKGDGEPHTVVAQPIEVRGELEAVVVLDVTARPERELEQALRELSWGSAWLELASGVAGQSNERLVALLELLSVPLEHERFKAAATAFTTELATRFECERVSLGHHAYGHTKLVAISHSAQFEKRADFTRRIEAAMEEAIDYGSEVVWPPPTGETPALTHAHETLARDAEGHAVVTIPIARGEELCGAVTLERAQPFLESELELIEPAIEMAGASLEIHRRDDRTLPRKIGEAARTTATELVGPRHVALKLGATVVALVVLFMIVAKGDFRVTADTTLEARVLRAAVAPFEGYIQQAPHRAGDQVAKGALLAQLDDRDLVLEHASYVSRLEQHVKQYRQAMAERNSPEVRILAAKVDQVRAQRDLAADKLSRTRITAPFDGLVVTGDLSQQLGSPVKRGDLLFEVAPLDDYRPVLEVDERDIDEIAVGQRGQLVLSAYPDEPVGLTVETITPVSNAAEGRNRFRVEAVLDATPEVLRPGMEGVAKVEVDRRRLIWIWTHELVDWLRLTLWNWMP